MCITLVRFSWNNRTNCDKRCKRIAECMAVHVQQDVYKRQAFTRCPNCAKTFDRCPYVTSYSPYRIVWHIPCLSLIHIYATVLRGQQLFHPVFGRKRFLDFRFFRTEVFREQVIAVVQHLSLIHIFSLYKRERQSV